MKHAYDPARMLLLNSTVAELKRKNAQLIKITRKCAANVCTSFAKQLPCKIFFYT